MVTGLLDQFHVDRAGCAFHAMGGPEEGLVPFGPPRPDRLFLQGEQIVINREQVLLDLAEERDHQPLDELFCVHTGLSLTRPTRLVS